MSAFDSSSYEAGDLLYLWWLGSPDHPIFIGELETARSMQGVHCAMVKTG